MKWLVGSLILSAFLSVALCVDPDSEVVKRIISSSKKFFRDNKLNEVDLGEFFITPVQFKAGKLAQLDTLELLEDPKIAKKPSQGGVTYDFNLKLGLKKLIIKYQFEVLLPLVGKKGTVSVDAGKNSFHADGHVLIGNDGKCSAVLNDAYVNTLGDYQVKIEPKDLMMKLYEGTINDIVHKELSTVVSLNIQGKKLSKSFKENFNNIVCSEMK